VKPNPTLFAAKLPLCASQKGFPAAFARFQFKQRHHHTAPTIIYAICAFFCDIKPCQLVLCAAREGKGKYAETHPPYALVCAILAFTSAARSVLVCAGAGLGDGSLRFITIKPAQPPLFPCP